jgi:hypothetical protein
MAMSERRRLGAGAQKGAHQRQGGTRTRRRTRHVDVTVKAGKQSHGLLLVHVADGLHREIGGLDTRHVTRAAI